MTYIVGRHRENTPALPHLSSSLSLAVQPRQLYMHLQNTNKQTHFFFFFLSFVILIEQVAMKTVDNTIIFRNWTLFLYTSEFLKYHFFTAFNCFYLQLYYKLNIVLCISQHKFFSLLEYFCNLSHIFWSIQSNTKTHVHKRTHSSLCINIEFMKVTFWFVSLWGRVEQSSHNKTVKPSILLHWGAFSKW